MCAQQRTTTRKIAKKAVAELSEQQKKDAAYAELSQKLLADESIPTEFRELADDPRVTVRRGGFIELAKNGKPAGKCIVYWMQRAQRGRDNHALDKAIALGNALGLPVVVYFAAISNFPHANLRHYAFLGRGLWDVEEDCAARGVGFVLRREPHEDHERFFADVNAAMVIGDENPMRAPEQWRVKLAKHLRIPFWTLDADVIVPSKLLGKAQFSAGVARPRLYRALPEFLVPYENPHADMRWTVPRGLQHDDVRADIAFGWTYLDRSVPPVESWIGGHHAARKRLDHFCKTKLKTYERDRNHPESDGTTGLSPYLHFGHIGPLTIALAVQKAVKEQHLRTAKDSLFNELIVWRELAVNFVRYQPEYDSTACADNWARLTIAEHDRDEREVLYTRRELEEARTQDELWNAAQMQMVRHGWMHNYMRMYWGKKVVEWMPNARTAMETLINLNDKYELDGRDPNGYAGIAWAVLGKFDRAWGERPVFGKRRTMSYDSTCRKFDAKRYIAQVQALAV